MDDVEFEQRLRVAFRHPVRDPRDKDLLAAASELVGGGHPRRAAVPAGPVLVAIASVAIVATLRMMAAPGTGGPVGAARLAVENTSIEVTALDRTLRVLVNGSEIAGTIPVSESAVSAVQILCPPSVGLSGHLVLVGVRGSEGTEVAVVGSTADAVAYGDEGTFVIAVTPLPTPGTSWVLRAGSSSVSGPVAGWVTRTIGSIDSNASLACRAVSTAGVK